MKKFFIATILLGLSLNLFAQVLEDQNYEKRNSITIGFLQGGGSIVGADFETLLSKQFGVQVGAGLIGFGAGINYHLYPTINSSFISLQYWHQGVGNSHTQSLLGPNFVFRGKKWFTAQIGLGFALDKGPAWPSSMQQPPVMLMYSIGAYFPL